MVPQILSAGSTCAFIISFYFTFQTIVDYIKYRPSRTNQRRSYACLAIGEWLAFFAMFLEHKWIFMWIAGLLAMLWTWLWWTHRDKDGKMKKALKEWGEKSKAKIKEMVDNMTPSPIPSPASG